MCSTYFVFDSCLLILIQMHLNQLRTIQLHTNALANNFSWEDEIVQDVVIDSCQSAATWALLFVWVRTTTTRFGQNFTFSAEHDMLAREFLLQLTHKTGLNLLERLLFWNWDVDDDGLKDK